MRANGGHCSLETGAIVATIEQLGLRIEERFPGSGLSRVSQDLLAVARRVRQRAAEIARPQTALRVVVAVGIGLLVVALVAVPQGARVPPSFALPELLQLTEAAMNLLVLVGGAIFFLATIERRLQRRRALAAIHELRSLAHVIDMHQLAKDPQRVLDADFVTTSSSPTTPLTPFELSRYLDYCSEMFSLIGKLAAVYGAELDDPDILNAVNDIESLTTGLSRKVWQKIMILQSAARFAAG